MDQSLRSFVFSRYSRGNANLCDAVEVSVDKEKARIRGQIGKVGMWHWTLLSCLFFIALQEKHAHCVLHRLLLLRWEGDSEPPPSPPLLLLVFLYVGPDARFSACSADRCSSRVLAIA